MLVNKKLGRFKQWAGERMGGEVKTNTSDDFKALEMEMGLRQEGMEKMQRSMTTYVKTLSKRSEAEDKEKILPVANLGSTMTAHGEDFEQESEFGQCLNAMGRANERIARIQEGYVSKATSTWLESLDRSLVQMREYQNSRKKLETRRLAYDTSISKMQKAKKEDFRVEEELRSQKAKYEESSEDVLRRMEDIKEAEADSVADLTSFLDAELEYYERCTEVLTRLKREWPAKAAQQQEPKASSRRPERSRTTAIYTDTASEPPPAPKYSIRSTRPPPSRTSTGYQDDVSDPEEEEKDLTYRPAPAPRPKPASRQPSATITRSFEGPTHQHLRESSPAARLARATATTTASPGGLLRQTTDPSSYYLDASDESFTSSHHTTANSSPDVARRTRSASPATSLGSQPNGSATSLGLGSRRAPPPPPPSRAKKPAPPPPPPMKRSALSSGNVLSS